MAYLNLPQLIILYGPPGSGKGTQLDLLQKEFGLNSLDWGHAFRSFAAAYKNNVDSPEYVRAVRVDQALTTGQAILTEDMLHIIGSRIVDLCSVTGGHAIMDKPGSLPPEAEWISSFLKEKSISSCLIHLPLDEDTSVQRITHRYYVPNDSFPHQSYEDALQYCPPGVIPIMRKEDQDESIIRKRFFNLYGKHAQEILDIYTKNNFTKIVEINAKEPIETVHQNIITFLTNTYSNL